MEIEKRIIEKIVKGIVADRLDLGSKKVKLNSVLVKELGMDSFGAVELTYELKDKFGIEIPQEDFVKIKTVEDIINYILAHLDKR